MRNAATPGQKQFSTGWTISGLLLVLAVAACSDPMPPVTEEVRPEVIFVRDNDVFTMRLDGSGLTNVTRHAARYSGIQLSPDGRVAAFASDRSGCTNLWAVNTDGTNLRQLTGATASERCNVLPMWSNDGTRIAFTSSRDPELGWAAYVMNADGSAVVHVSAGIERGEGVNAVYAVGWSPDHRVVLASEVGGKRVTYTVNADGTGLQLFSEEGFQDPYWSPDGSRLVATRRAVEGLELFMMNADMSGAVKLAAGAASAYVPAYVNPWSPDGSKVAFAARQGDKVSLFTADASGAANELTQSAGTNHFSAWSPDGSRLLYTTLMGDQTRIYVINADGTGTKSLSNGAANEDYPRWIATPSH